MFRSYSIYLITTILIITFVPICFVIVIDPYAVWHRNSWPGINSERVRMAALGFRSTHGVVLNRQDFDIILVGNSRLQIGINPEGPHLERYSAYSAGLQAATIDEIISVLRIIASKENLPKQLMLALDFAMFSPGARYTADFEISPLNRVPVWKTLLLTTLSVTGVKDAYTTLARNREGKVANYNLLGHYHKLWPWQIDQRKKFFDELKSYAVSPNLYAGFDPKKVSIETGRILELQSVLFDIANGGTRVSIWTNPLHVSMLKLIDYLGLAPEFDYWKESLLKISDDLEESFGMDKVSFWDFNYCGKLATHERPVEGSTEEFYIFHDPSHYKPDIGELILSKVLVSRDLENTTNQSFLSSAKHSQIVPINWETCNSNMDRDIAELVLQTKEDRCEVNKSFC